MQATLEDFFKALRGSDIEVSLNAQIDAARATALVGWRERELLKSALGATLVKTVPDRAIFDQTFDRFFHFDTFGTRPAGQPGAAPAAVPPPDEQPLSSAEGSGQGSGGPGGCQGSAGQALSQLLLAGDSAALSRRMQQAARDVGLTDIWFFTQKGYYTQKIQRAMGLDLLDREITEARRQTQAPQRAGRARTRAQAPVQRSAQLRRTQAVDVRHGADARAARRLPADAEAVQHRPPRLRPHARDRAQDRAPSGRTPCAPQAARTARPARLPPHHARQCGLRRRDVRDLLAQHQDRAPTRGGHLRRQRLGAPVRALPAAVPVQPGRAGLRRAVLRLHQPPGRRQRHLRGAAGRAGGRQGDAGRGRRRHRLRAGAGGHRRTADAPHRPPHHGADPGRRAQQPRRGACRDHEDACTAARGA